MKNESLLKMGCTLSHEYLMKFINLAFVCVCLVPYALLLDYILLPHSCNGIFIKILLQSSILTDENESPEQLVLEEDEGETILLILL